MSEQRRLVIVPTLNERENLPALVERILAVEGGFDVLVVDDNSPDGTGDLADEIALHEPRIHCLHRPRKEGLARAYLDAFRWALARPYSEIFHMDADLSHEPESLPSLAATLDRADVAIGSRYVLGGSVRGWSLSRRILSRWGSLYARFHLRLPVKDLTGGFKGFRRRVLETIDLSRVSSIGYSFMIEVTYRAVRAGFRIEEVPIRFAERRSGKSKMSLRIALEAAWRVPALRLERR